MVTEQMEVLISATAIMLTFGFKNYLTLIVSKIIIYPKAYHSQINDTYHKGEINLQLKAIIFSWEDFVHGYDIGNDNLNLGIHEFGHAVHMNSLVNTDISAQIFTDGFKELKTYLKSNEAKRQELISTKYFRAYAYTNEFEFIAVILECFFETPEEFRSTFPRIYALVKQMLNFKFAGY